MTIGLETIDLDELDRESREAVNEDPNGSMTLPTKTVRELVARLLIAQGWGGPVAPDLDKLEQLARAATQGPWYASTAGTDTLCHGAGPEHRRPNPVEWNPHAVADAAFIAAANPAAVRELVQRLRAAEAERDMVPIARGARQGANDDGEWRMKRLAGITPPDGPATYATLLAIVRDLAACDPTYDVDMGMGSMERGCRWCITLRPKLVADHKPGCLWRRAVEASKP